MARHVLKISSLIARQQQGAIKSYFPFDIAVYCGYNCIQVVCYHNLTIARNWRTASTLFVKEVSQS